MYLLGDSKQFYSLDSSLSFVKQPACPYPDIFTANTYWLGKDADLGYIFAVQSTGAVNTLKDGAIASTTIPELADKISRDIHLIQCYNQSFST